MAGETLSDLVIATNIIKNFNIVKTSGLMDSVFCMCFKPMFGLMKWQLHFLEKHKAAKIQSYKNYSLKYLWLNIKFGGF